MQTATRGAPPPTLSGGTGPPRTNRRWLRWVALVLGGLVIASATTLLALAANYQPLQGGPKAWPPPPGVGATARYEHWLQPSGGQLLPTGAELIVIPAPQGLTFRYRFSFFNHGRFAVTMTSIGYPAAQQASNGVTVTTSAVDPNGSGWESFRPFTLGPREGADVEMLVNVTSCMKPGESIEWNSERMTYTVFGIHRADTVPTNVQIQLAGLAQTC